MEKTLTRKYIPSGEECVYASKGFLFVYIRMEKSRS